MNERVRQFPVGLHCTYYILISSMIKILNHRELYLHLMFVRSQTSIHAQFMQLSKWALISNLYMTTINIWLHTALQTRMKIAF